MLAKAKESTSLIAGVPKALERGVRGVIAAESVVASLVLSLRL